MYLFFAYQFIVTCCSVITFYVLILSLLILLDHLRVTTIYCVHTFLTACLNLLLKI